VSRTSSRASLRSMPDISRFVVGGVLVRIEAMTASSSAVFECTRRLIANASAAAGRACRAISLALFGRAIRGRPC